MWEGGVVLKFQIEIRFLYFWYDFFKKEKKKSVSSTAYIVNIAKNAMIDPKKESITTLESRNISHKALRTKNEMLYLP